jgi:hypothetical protein
MYLVCNLMPEGSNTARELSRQFRSLNTGHWKEAEIFVGYLKANKDELKLVIKKGKSNAMCIEGEQQLCDKQGQLQECEQSATYGSRHIDELAIKNERISHIKYYGSGICCL